MQLSLEKSGLLAPVEVPNLANDSVVNSDHLTVHSSLFWEAPALALGSELLATLRNVGWLPFYARRSGRLPCADEGPRAHGN